ncbi:TMEM175 family protein [Dyella sp. C11]|uniref:TMEM175 family protein n=1 Tax=Dyella sp. C11 TaxID=2126991 RepID=UPI000D65A35B|nr:TMEM175 family protein [Dyella sp. C11]
MSASHNNADRLVFFGDAVFAIIITLLVLGLRPPDGEDWHALLGLWPSFVSYGVSYLFLAIVWVNHHHLFRHRPTPTSQLIWANFAHLFSVSFVPFTTIWIANTRLAPVPVAIYAFVFLLVNATYMMLCMEVLDRQHMHAIPGPVRRAMLRRSVLTLLAFLAAAVIALIYPIAGLVIVCFCLILYLRPEIAESAKTLSSHDGLQDDKP